MKNIKFLLALFVLGIMVFSCREELTEPGYDGNSKLHFNMGTSKSDFVMIDTGSKNIEISYGVIKEAATATQVKLVVDAAASTAVEGVDYQILKGTDDLAVGELGGKFLVKMMEPANAGIQHKVVFKLESSAIDQAIFDTKYTLNWKLQCTLTTFIGNGLFTADPGLFSGTWDQEILVDPNNPNKIILKDYIVTGHNIVLTIDDSGVVSFDPQETGYINGASGMIFIKPATDGTTSVYDACNRTLELRANYYGPAGNYGNVTDVLTGQ